MLSVEIRSLLAIVSLGFGIYGIFFLGLFFGPPAIFCAVIALYTVNEQNQLDLVFRAIAFIGLILGTFELIFGLLAALGIQL